MAKPKKPRKRRTLGDLAQDLKQKRRARKGSRKIRRTLKGSAEKASKEVRDRRGERREKIESRVGEKKTVNPRTRRKERRMTQEAGGFTAKGLAKTVPTGKAKRAKRTLGRMEEQDKRRLKRKIK